MTDYEEWTNSELRTKRNELVGMQAFGIDHKPTYDKVIWLIAGIDLELDLRADRRSRSSLKLGHAIRRNNRSAFSHYDHLGFNDPAMRPDSSACEGCPQWDDINGCWDNCRSIMQCRRMGEESHYIDPDMDGDIFEYEPDDHTW